MAPKPPKGKGKGKAGKAKAKASEAAPNPGEPVAEAPAAESAVSTQAESAAAAPPVAEGIDAASAAESAPAAEIPPPAAPAVLNFKEELERKLQRRQSKPEVESSSVAADSEPPASADAASGPPAPDSPARSSPLPSVAASSPAAASETEMQFAGEGSTPAKKAAPPPPAKGSRPPPMPGLNLPKRPPDADSVLQRAQTTPAGPLSGADSNAAPSDCTSEVSLSPRSNAGSAAPSVDMRASPGAKSNPLPTIEASPKRETSRSSYISATSGSKPDEPLLFAPKAGSSSGSPRPAVGQMYTTWQQKNLGDELQVARAELLEAKRRAAAMEEENRRLQQQNKQLKQQLDVNNDRDELLRDIRNESASTGLQQGSFQSGSRLSQQRSGPCGSICALFGRR